MNVVMSYSLKDYNLAFFAAKTLVEKTDVDPSKLILYASKHAPAPPSSMNSLGIKFTQCDKDTKVYPQGPNIMAAMLFQAIGKGKFGKRVFMTEPDGFPTCKDWYDKVLKGHLDTNAWVTGSIVDWVNPVHLNGNLVIESQFVASNKCLSRPVNLPWDCHHAELLMSAGAKNRDISNPRRDFLYYPTPWWKQFDEAWVHGCQNFQMWEDIHNNGL